jgi:hypothetical protein
MKLNARHTLQYLVALHHLVTLHHLVALLVLHEFVALPQLSQPQQNFPLFPCS